MGLEVLPVLLACGGGLKETIQKYDYFDGEEEAINKIKKRKFPLDFDG
jgi:hypothetical protein